MGVTKKAQDCSWIEVEHTSAVFAAVVLNPLAFAAQYFMYGTVPQIPHASPMQVSLILLAAAGCFVGIAMETKGYQLADPGRASMFRNAEVPLGYVLQQFGTSSPLSIKALLGSVCILVSCVLGVFREKYLAEAEASKSLISDSEGLKRSQTLPGSLRTKGMYNDVPQDDVESVGSNEKTSAGSTADNAESVDFSDGGVCQPSSTLE